MIKKLIITLFLLSGLSLFCQLSWADAQTDFDAARKAYNSKDYKAAFKLFKYLAEQGDASAQFNLGNMYRLGQSVAQDYQQAVYWYQKAAEQGLAEAQYNLGNMYDNGQGVAQNDKQAMYWYQKAADQGFAEAQYNSRMSQPENLLKALHSYLQGR
ncbi:tetratricopeptide repeat protein [Candidatus Nitrosacidococcus tergens]|uniref:Putative Beta-lactamase n=1 Tax=Candidatus Nitrosacidococcus tergens TaxID=553981 RepID=A0A7G1QAR3_9GAMM|nr:tetratricopeptide repeat protein [Candidatus Nitrosacidococcus tergens]CAB1276849.1 putative Beta-lactamase [Candidatus Nitrosacidococcus tergens]